MHGSTLVTTEELICLAASPDDAVVDRIASWASEHGLGCTVHSFDDAVSMSADGALGVAVGGDGTFLEAVGVFGPHEVPITGVNRGTLAFLSRLPPAALEDALAEMLRGEAAVVERQQFQVSGPGLDATGINDVTVRPQSSVSERRTCRVRVFVDDEYVGEYDGGGLVVSTPTGSTAMALSAGGPVHYPAGDETLQLTALHRDGLGVAPIVLDADRAISLVPANTVEVSVDGGRSFAVVGPDDCLRVTGQDPAYLVRTSYEQSFMRALTSKLGWPLRADGPPDIPRASDGFDIDSRPRSADAVAHGLTGRTPRGPADIWRELQRESAPRVGWWRDRPQWPARDERPTWLRRESGGRNERSAARRTGCEAVLAAGELLARSADRLATADREHRSELVAEAERGSEQILAAIVGNAFPAHGIRSGGTQLRGGDGLYTWLLDPIDGIGNFEHGNPSYCVTLALLADGTPEVGIVYAPAAEELFHAVRGGDAYRNDVPIEPTGRDQLGESMLLSGYDPDGAFLRHFYQQTRGVRRLGSQALNLCYVAAGSADAVWEYDTYSWDVAAGVCLLRSAGGRVTDPDGNEYSISDDGRTPLLASNGALHPSLLDLLP